MICYQRYSQQLMTPLIQIARQWTNCVQKHRGAQSLTKMGRKNTYGQHEFVRAEMAKSLQNNKRGAAYSQERKQLLEEESRDAWDAAAKSRASQVEIEAAQILRRICETERQGPLFGDLPGEAQPSPDSRDLGGRFLRNRERIQQSKILAIADAAPKGAHLHIHFNTELPPEELLQYARNRPELKDTFVIRSDRPLRNANDFQQAEIVFSVITGDNICGDLFSNHYQPDLQIAQGKAWMRWSEFRERFASIVPRLHATLWTETLQPGEIHLDPAESWVREKMIVTQRLKYERAITHNHMWACFNQGTRAFKGLLNYEGVYRWYIGHLIQSMIDQHIMYAQLRPMLMDKAIPSDDSRRQLDHRSQMDIILEEVRKKQAELAAIDQLAKFPFGLKIIYCTPRSIPRARMETELADCIKLKLQHPDLICGFDLVGAEDRPNSIGFYADLLLAFTDACKCLNIHIPFMFHAGETLLDSGGTDNPDNSNLYDALLLNAVRVGHGYSLMKHPMLIERFKRQGIALELCPTSNELLSLCGNAREHPYPSLLAAGLHCTLNADNPAPFRYVHIPAHKDIQAACHQLCHCPLSPLTPGGLNLRSSLSHEFYQVMVGDTRMSLHGWRQLAEWSIEHACLRREEKDEGLKIFRADWERFCEKVVEDYSVCVRV